MEIALNEVPVFAGGLGVLEGDKFYTAARLGLEYYEITMFYEDGYVEYDYKDGNFVERPQNVKKVETLLEREKELTIDTKIFGQIRVVPLVFKKGKAKVVYLKVESPEKVYKYTSRLYVEDSPEQAIAKYIVFGRGASQYIRERIGISQVERLDLQESMSALAALELKELKDKVRLIIHTPGPWGHPYIPDEVLRNEYSMDPDSKLVRITDVILDKVSAGIGVSRKHWETLHKIFPTFSWKISYVRNGIDLERWTHDAIKALSLRKVSIDELKVAKKKTREDLESLLRSYKPGVKINGTIIAWARRVTKYKRPNLVEGLIRDLGKEVDVTFVLAGKAHPRENEGREYMIKFRKLHEEFENVVYIHDYNLEIAKAILSGSDLLLFTPFPGWEACGTSYMKAGVNGVPTLSSRDGGTLETIIDGFNGWFFGSELTQFVNIYEDKGTVESVDERDYKDLRSKLLKILELKDKDPEAYLDVSLNALKSFTVSSNMERAFREYGYL